MALVERIRLSIGTALKLGLLDGPVDPYFTTAFVMTFHPTKCEANCAFCPQARTSTSSADKLSRISWPDFALEEVISHWPDERRFARICIQTLCYDEVVSDAAEIAKALRSKTDRPISIALHPVSKSDMEALKTAGITTMGIALDACTAPLFEKIKGKERGSSYRWRKHFDGLRDALDVFGRGNVTTHLIIGLGETEQEVAEFLFDVYEMGITVGLFAFTPIEGTSLQNRLQPDIAKYRRIQVVRHLIHRDVLKPDMVSFDSQGRIRLELPEEELRDLIGEGAAFRVSGCPGCNRPYYNERPSGTMYNYPMTMSRLEIETALQESELV